MAGLEGYPGFLSDITQGSTRDFIIKLSRKLDNDIIEPIDLTGSKFYITFDKDRNVGTSPVLEISILIPTDPENGLTTGKITASQSMNLEIGGYFYSVRWINTLGDPYVIDLGIININPGVSDKLS